MKLLFSNYLGRYSYPFQGSFELISITVTVSLFFLRKAVTENNSPQSGIFKNLLQLQLHDLMVFELEMSGRPRFGSVRLRFGGGTVRAVPVFGSGGSSAKKAFLCFSTV